MLTGNFFVGTVSVFRYVLSVVRCQRFLLTSSPPKPLGLFGRNLAGMFLGRSSLKTDHRIVFHQKLLLL